MCCWRSAFVNYLLRNNISVALPSIRKEFDYTSTELGWILGGFNVAYALCQVPGGLFGTALGPRRALALIAVAWGVLTWLTGFVPAVFAGSATAALLGLMVVRFLMGVTHAPIFPVSSGAIAQWFPIGRWAFPNAMQNFGLGLGQACVGPVVTFLIIAVGWRASFYWLAPLGFAVAAWWWFYARDTPREHAAVDAGELALIQAGREAEFAIPATSTRPDTAPSRRAVMRSVLLDRNVLVLAASYFCMNCTFYIFADWLFTYLVEERKFSLLAGGLLFALPFIVGSVFAVLGGLVCDALCQRIGPRWGCRIAGDRRPVDGLDPVAGRSPRPESLHGRRIAGALFRLHAVLRCRVLVGRHICRTPAHERRRRRDEHGRQSAGVARPVDRLADRPCRLAADLCGRVVDGGGGCGSVVAGRHVAQQPRSGRGRVG